MINKIKNIFAISICVMLIFTITACTQNKKQPDNLISTTQNENITKEDGKMKPVRFVESKGMIICGKSGGDVGSAWHDWESLSVEHKIKHYLPSDKNENPGAGAFEARFYPPEGEYDFVGEFVSKKDPDSVWDYLEIPAATYAVFDIDHKIDQNSQFAELNEWLAANENEYTRFEWDAHGKITKAIFVLCVYDHTEKFAKEQIMEMWIPLVKK